MLNAKRFLFPLGLGLIAALPALGATTYRLSCDDDNIFEVPLAITIHGNTASAHGEFSGPGDAFFSVDYTKLAAIDLKTHGNALESVTLAQPVVAGHRSGFHLVLTADGADRWKGKINLISTDENKMPYDGDVECTTRN
jgi:hypothetical protein